jgi:uncharacterized membrane protein
LTGGSRAALDRLSRDPAFWIVTLLTALGLALRLIADTQSVFGDELVFTREIAIRASGPVDVIELVRDDSEGVVELNPPLFYLLAWAASELDSSPEAVRIPSLLAGTAAIPLTYVLGTQTVGRRAGLIGTALVAVSPFLVFQSAQGRAYGFIGLVVIASTLTLLRAVETRSKVWWGAYAAVSCLAMYTHYTAAFPLIAQATWALWAYREAWRGIVVANLAAAIGFLPWLSEFLDDSESPFNVLPFIHPFSFDTATSDIAQWLVEGYPYPVGLDRVEARRVPGWSSQAW